MGYIVYLLPTGIDLNIVYLYDSKTSLLCFSNQNLGSNFLNEYLINDILFIYQLNFSIISTTWNYYTIKIKTFFSVTNKHLWMHTTITFNTLFNIMKLITQYIDIKSYKGAVNTVFIDKSWTSIR